MGNVQAVDWGQVKLWEPAPPLITSLLGYGTHGWVPIPAPGLPNSPPDGSARIHMQAVALINLLDNRAQVYQLGSQTHALPSQVTRRDHKSCQTPR